MSEEQKAVKVRKHPQLWQAYLWWDDMVEMRKRHLLRISSAERGVSTYDPHFERDLIESFQLDSLVEQTKQIMISYGEAVGPIWEWLVGIKGIGPSLAARVLALIDDIGKFATISKLWRYSGYGLYPYWIGGNGKVMAPRNGYQWDSDLGKPVPVVQEPKDSWTLVQRPDLGVKGWLLPFSKPLKSTLWVVAKSLVTQRTPVYTDYYYQVKEDLKVKHPEPIKVNGRTKYTLGHIDNMARRKMKKLLLCYSDDTEIWAQEGPVWMREVKVGDKVMTLNPVSGCIEYRPVESVQAFEYSGDMIHFVGESWDLSVTPNHRMWAKKRGQDWRFVEARHFTDNTSPERENAEKATVLAKDLIDKGLSVVKASREVNVPETTLRRWLYEGQYPLGITSETWEFKTDADWVGTDDLEVTDEWLEFFGWWLAEGHTYKNPNHPGGYVVGVTQNDRSVLERLAGFLKEWGYRPFYAKNQLRVYSKKLYERLVIYGKSYEKWIPFKLKQLPPVRLRILLGAMLAGDGSWKPSGWPRLYTTVSKRLQLDVAEIALKCGYGIRLSTKSKEQMKGANYDQHQVHLRIKRVTPRLGKPKRKLYEGLVRCVTIPNHIVFVGRNGKFTWCGNSHLWLKWREFEGLPVTEPYVQAIMGHTNIIAPP